jgi:prepilin-type N-terminal cleavage/methylation domain-containing protein
MAEVRKSRAFTLVELLVVISIIAILLAVLMPTLRKARNQAKVMLCASNSKQIGLIMTVYQNENNGCVPVMRNKATPINAKSGLLSIPFRKYSGATVALPKPFLDPDNQWNVAQMLYYAQNYLPAFYICPFARGNPQATLFQDAGTVLIGTTVRLNYVSVGKMDSYSTWIWPRPKNFNFWPEGEHPWGPPNGYNKYGNVVWHSAGSPDPDIALSDDEPYSGYLADDARHNDWMESHPRKFSNTRRLSQRTALYCAHGEIDESLPNNRIYNYGSHKKQGKGGTNVVFGDSHVDWIQGSQISAGN